MEKNKKINVNLRILHKEIHLEVESQFEERSYRRAQRHLESLIRHYKEQGYSTCDDFTALIYSSLSLATENAVLKEKYKEKISLLEKFSKHLDKLVE